MNNFFCYLNKKKKIKSVRAALVVIMRLCVEVQSDLCWCIVIFALIRAVLQTFLFFQLQILAESEQRLSTLLGRLTSLRALFADHRRGAVRG